MTGKWADEECSHLEVRPKEGHAEGLTQQMEGKCRFPTVPGMNTAGADGPVDSHEDRQITKKQTNNQGLPWWCSS